MISYPRLKAKAPYRQKLDKFRGYNHNLRIGSGEFYEMENLTSDDYPVLSVRKKRGLVANLNYGCDGMLYVPEKGLFFLEDVGGNSVLYLLTPEGVKTEVTRALNPNSKKLVLIGKQLVIAPDMKWVDIETLACGEIAYKNKIFSGEIHVALCMEDGTKYPLSLPPESFAPDGFEDGTIYIDKSVYPPVLKQYSALQNEWVNVSTTYVRISGEGLSGHSFCPQDGITISGLGIKEGTVDNYDAHQLNGNHVVCSCDSQSIVIEGMLAFPFAQQCEKGAITFEREVPKLDFVVEAGNRLWGCKKDTNEIYSCKLGDIFNWNCFQGLSTDSWVGSIGTPGEFTGAAVQNGYPVFYKENCKHKVWPSATGAHQITTTPCNGVEKGSQNSIAVLDGTVFYKSACGVFADDGGGSVEIGQALGDTQYRNASGAILNRKYYLNVSSGVGKYHLFVYDIDRKMWHREDFSVSNSLSISGHLVAGGNSLYAASRHELWDLTGNTGTPEETVSWMAVTGDLGLELPEQKYISRLTLRLSLDPGATLEVYAQYDREQTWVKLGQVYGTDLRSFSLPVRPRRCDQLRLKLQGTGMCKLYSITKTLEKGSELT